MALQYPFIRVIYNDKREGFAVAARRLYTEAKCPIIFFTDSDGQYVASEFWKLTPFIGDADIVHGAKIGRQDPLYRRVASALFNGIARVVFGTSFSDINSAFRLVRKSFISSTLAKARHLPTLLNAELLIRADLENRPVKQIEVIHRARKSGVSRGLPPGRFLSESWKAFRGLLALRREYKLYQYSVNK